MSRRAPSQAVNRRGLCLTVLGAVLSVALAGSCRRASSGLPASLTDAGFWTLTSELSEPPGVFTHSDNLVSNETRIGVLAGLLRRMGGVYIGVGPEQNFSYIAGVAPGIAFIVDIRDENRSLHLLYKALFELSSDRAGFLSRLFSRERPAALARDAPVTELFAAYESAPFSARLREETGRLVRERLVDRHRFPLEQRQLEWLTYVLDAFAQDGPGISYGRLRGGDFPSPSYRELMTAPDIAGHASSYLADENRFEIVRRLEMNNLVVPVVGNFASGVALGRIGDWVRIQSAEVSAFYGSNVEAYLTRSDVAVFCAALERLPHGPASWFISSKDMEPLDLKLRRCPERSDR
jgi:hypothetical protein